MRDLCAGLNPTKCKTQTLFRTTKHRRVTQTGKKKRGGCGGNGGTMLIIIIFGSDNYR